MTCARIIASHVLAVAALAGCATALRPGDQGGGGVDAGGTPAVVLPRGARCAPLVATADFPSAVDGGDETSNGSEAACPPSADAGPPSGFDPVHPLGLGYPDIKTPLPAHVAYLTFDDGPSDWTNDFLDILETKKVAATFFVTARQLKGPAGLDGTYVDEHGHTWVYRDLVKREVDDGDSLGNHTVDHPDLGAIDPEQIQSELDEDEYLINTALVRAGGTPAVLSLFRPPFGSPWYRAADAGDDPAGAPAAAAQRVVPHGLNVMWTIDSTDSREWAHDESFSRTPGAVAPSPGAPTYAEKTARLVKTVLGDPSVARGDGIVVLMHDTHETTRDVLPDIIAGLSSAGYSFDTIEHYAQWRWGRPSRDLTPGPSLYSSCTEDRNWGCESFQAPVGTDRSHEVCGRMWLAYRALGGAPVTGDPTAAPRSSTAGVLSQSFEHGVVELHPENPPPCNVVFIPR